MSSHPKTPAEIEETVWRELKHHNTVLLAVAGDHPQPMTAFSEPENGLIWFITQADSDIARKTKAAANAMLTLQRERFQASVAGALSQTKDAARIDKFWNPVVAAWFPKGKDDPSITLLRFACGDAQVWVADSALKFVWQVAKANATKTLPDVGQKTDVSLA
jgi:general stress protein 26